MALFGIALLYRGGDGMSLDTLGVFLVMVSSLTYALYIIILNKSFLRMSSLKLTFYVLSFGIILIIINSILEVIQRVFRCFPPRGLGLLPQCWRCFPQSYHYS